jgi:hypothetical protein
MKPKFNPFVHLEKYTNKGVRTLNKKITEMRDSEKDRMKVKKERWLNQTIRRI